MRELVELTTADLKGVELNWATFCAVYKGMGLEPTINVIEACTHEMRGLLKPIEFPRSVSLSYLGAYGAEYHWNPSGDWECAGPLIDQLEVEILRSGSCVHAKLYGKTDSAGTGDTTLVAVCRAIVASVFGEKVCVPKELTQ